MPEDNASDAGITLKAGKGYEAPWFTPRGTLPEIRQQLIDFIGFEPEAVATLSVAELAVQAAYMFHALYNAGFGLGAQPLGVAEGTPYAGPTGADAWGSAGGKDDPPFEPNVAKDPLIAALENVGTLGELGDLYVQHKDAFARPEIADAAKAARARIDGAS